MSRYNRFKARNYLPGFGFATQNFADTQFYAFFLTSA
ncbi:hypothetical protein GGD52_000715 [Agrobacterium tumefaciens]|nr:hypothetical protein [Agrobacterium radiobacter]MBB5586158.1 hypothetical protein [Agrobacterium radiobacter]